MVVMFSGCRNYVDLCLANCSFVPHCVSDSEPLCYIFLLSSTILNLLKLNLMHSILIVLATKCVQNFPLPSSYVQHSLKIHKHPNVTLPSSHNRVWPRLAQVKRFCWLCEELVVWTNLKKVRNKCLNWRPPAFTDAHSHAHYWSMASLVVLSKYRK